MQTPLSVLLKEKGKKVHTISKDLTCYECAKHLTEFNIGALLVMEGNQVLGIISERDLIKKLITKNLDPTKATIEQVMTQNVIAVPPEATVQTAMEIITEKRLRHLPIIDNGKLVGMISIGDVTRWVMLQQQKEISALTGYIQGT
jgi:CBS domain-containing protein